MPIINSTTGAVSPELSAAELKQKAQEMRAWAMTAIAAACSGHPGGSLSIADVVTALYLRQLKHDPQHPTGRSATASSGRRATKLPLSTPPWAWPVTTTSAR